MDKTLLKKYIKGELNQAQATKVIQWINSDMFDHDLIRSIEEDLHQEINVIEKFTTKQDLQRKIADIYNKANFESRYRHKHGNKKVFLRIAASVLLIFATGLFLYEHLETSTSSAEYASKQIIRENDRGRKSTIYLADGSIVHLNSESSIQYDELNFINNRTLLLSGEAYFEVAEDSIHPFKVVTSRVLITALGTSFNVDSYQKSDNIQVSLVSGKVLVENKKDSLINQEFFLNPGQSIRYHKENKIFSNIAPFNTQLITGWKDGILYFDRADLPTVMQKLERWFAVDFELLNKNPQSWRYTSQFKNQNLKNILESLSFSQNFNYEIKGKKVYIKFK